MDMMDTNSFNALIDEIMALGHNEDTAAKFARLIGDTPAFDTDGLVVVEEEGAVLARLKLKFFDGQIGN